jgi:EAL domain-containing protein (putative c-di-GMP-specific phosphodiesterase class I)
LAQNSRFAASCRRFVSGLGASAEDTTIVEAIVKMAAGLRIGVVAEGVETVEQARDLVCIGCSQAQGYHYARPMPGEEIAALLGERLPRVRAAPPRPPSS